MQYVKKPWGHEEIWAETEKYIGKILVVEEGKRNSFQYHEQKDETICVLEGELEVEFEKNGLRERITLKPGESFRNPPLQRHRYLGLKKSRVMEVSTPHPKDVVRLEDDFGRV